MARVLIAWELGEAFGHLARCLRLAEGLRERGHMVTLVLKDVCLPGGTVPGLTVLAAPQTAPRPAQRSVARMEPVNYADVLLHAGFADVQAVAARLHAWRSIFSLVCPDVLVGDHAPTALLAARGGGVPHIAVGTGFAVPPPVSPWPSIRPWDVVTEEMTRNAEVRLDRVTEAAQHLVGVKRAARMRELFGSQDVLSTFAELDHCGVRPDGRYLGPIVTLPECARVGWQGKDCPRVLLYLRPDVPGFSAIVRALARLDAEVLCVTPGWSVVAARHYATRRLRIALTPLALPPLLQRADIAVSYGSSGFSTQALLAGVPLLMRPRYVEQALLAHRVEALGAGRLLAGQLDVEGVAAAARRLLEASSERQAARSFALRYRDFEPQMAVDLTVAAIEQCALVAPERGVSPAG
ncbi:glycosyltransferase [Parazoarcus communis]|uniref:UDP-glucuronosyltransferase n=2 Tax=Parazoarcus communis TaxID=41977 RepID=A0A323UZ23_9RHOO|nr:nucleotide disphospho-sugar-binding domain-containing protein [Parazoarcus communis]PZA17481.1 UDP-glucuronosyltransferase [Azoarcus communis] [Parazoarcus communis SWub3 = DSM 12120]